MPEWSENILKNAFFATVRRNIRRFNEGKELSQTISGPVKKLLRHQELREILLQEKNIKKSDFNEKMLSDNALEYIYRIKETGKERDIEKRLELLERELAIAYPIQLIDFYYAKDSSAFTDRSDYLI